jgi:uncharacterized membrane protein YhaH (DUF805 family)
VEISRHLSVTGRIGRKTFWAMWGCIILVLVAAAVPAILVTRLGGIWIMVGNGFMSVVLIGCAWVSLANQIKRWHDLGRSGWMFLISFIPFVGFVANVICLGCLRGQAAANRFGPPPGGPAPEPVVGAQAPATASPAPPLLAAAPRRRSRGWKWVAVAGGAMLIIGPVLAAVVYVIAPQGTLTVRREWLRAQFGSAEAQERLAWRYRQGDGVPQDYAAAAGWFERAAAKGQPQAQYDTAVLYYYGIGRPLDPELAQSWLERAAQQEYAPASTLLGLMSVERSGDGEAALHFWLTAAGQGDPHAKALLGAAYLQRRGEDSEDLILALFWLESARRDGVEPVAGQLQHLWATVPEDQLELVTAEVFRRLEAGSPAPVPPETVSEAPPNQPAEVAPSADAPAAEVESPPPENDLPVEVEARIQELTDYADLDSLYVEKSQADAAWAESEDGQAVAGYLQQMRDDAAAAQIVPVDGGGEVIYYTIAGVSAQLDGVQFDRMKDEAPYRLFVAETIARNIAGAPKPLRIAELLKEARDRKGAAAP